MKTSVINCAYERVPLFPVFNFFSLNDYFGTPWTDVESAICGFVQIAQYLAMV